MRNRKWMGGLLALVMTSSSQAGTYAFTQLCWGADGTEATAFQSCSNTSAVEGSTASSVIKSTLNPDGISPAQVFVGTGSATATPDTWRVAMSLAVTDYRRDMYIWTESQTDGTYVATTAAAGASTTDSLTVTGGTGVYSLNYIFSLDGLLFSSNPSLISAGFSASLFIPTGTGGSASFFNLSAGESVPSTFTLTYADLPFGGPVDPTLQILVSGLVEPIYAADVEAIGAETITTSASAQFGSTIHLTSMLITDANGTPIPGLQISSRNGYAYPLDPRNTASVPEPSSLLLLAGGLGLFGLRRIGRGTR